MPKESSRRLFIRRSLKGMSVLPFAGFAFFDQSFAHLNCTWDPLKEIPDGDDLFFKISLAQWSLHRSFNSGTLNADEFPVIARERFGINAVDYVNSFYTRHVRDSAFWNAMRQRAKDQGVSNLILMVDDEGDLGNPKDTSRRKAVENHYKWVDAAELLGCHSIRVNGFGNGDREEVGNALVDGLGALAQYAAAAGINVVVENHGLYSSDGKWVVHVISRIGSNNCGTLPDFGNFCTARKWGSTQDGTCPEVYDRYLGVKEMMPYAKGVSAKSYRFDAQGQETIIDYGMMLRIVKEAGFTGYIGIEYEGNEMDEPDGIEATRRLLISEGGKF